LSAQAHFLFRPIPGSHLTILAVAAVKRSTAEHFGTDQYRQMSNMNVRELSWGSPHANSSATSQISRPRREAGRDVRGAHWADAARSMPGRKRPRYDPSGLPPTRSLPRRAVPFKRGPLA
jgi:hypothetical protein